MHSALARVGMRVRVGVRVKVRVRFARGAEVMGTVRILVMVTHPYSMVHT